MPRRAQYVACCHTSPPASRCNGRCPHGQQRSRPSPSNSQGLVAPPHAGSTAGSTRCCRRCFELIGKGHVAPSHRASLDAGPAAHSRQDCAHALLSGLGRIQQYPAVAGRRLGAAVLLPGWQCTLVYCTHPPWARARGLEQYLLAAGCAFRCRCAAGCACRLSLALHRTRRGGLLWSAAHRRAGLSSSCCLGWLCCVVPPAALPLCLRRRL